MQKLNLIIEISKKNQWKGKESVIITAVTKTMQKMLESHKRIIDKTCLISLLLSDDKNLHKMNLDYRNKDKPTNVLSFQNIDWENNLDIDDILTVEQLDLQSKNIFTITVNSIISQVKLAPETPVLSIGNIAISYERILEEAIEESKTFDEHLMFITIHGVLHLMGYDHEMDDEAKVMQRLEKNIILNLK